MSQSAARSPHEKFGFDTVFDAAGEVASSAPRPKRLFDVEEMTRLKYAAHAEGQEAANASLLARQTEALERIARACDQALPRLAEVAHEHRVGSARLALACAKAIAAAALDRFPEAPLKAALDALAREIETAPRLVVSAEPELAKRLQELLGEAAQASGGSGAIQVRPDETLGRHAFTLDFGDGHAAYDPEAASARVSQAMEAALAAEGLHAEPLIPGGES